jgi:hypothetical protein
MAISSACSLGVARRNRFVNAPDQGADHTAPLDIPEFIEMIQDKLLVFWLIFLLTRQKFLQADQEVPG